MLENPNSGKKRPFDKEVAFNDKRWADKEANQGRFGRKTKEDFMREEADRDNLDYEKKLHEEYGEWERHCKVVRERFLERARDPEKTNIVTVTIWMPGGMKADGVAGSALALDTMGMNSNTIDYVVGASSGDVVGTRLVGGRDELLRGIAMLEGPLADKEFIDPLRPGNAINLGYLKKLEDEGEYAIDEERIKDAHTKLWTLVSEPIQGKEPAHVKILDKKAIKEGITTGTVATMSIPAVTGKIPEIDGVKYYDGGFGILPVKEIVEKVKSENPGAEINVLIFAQTSFDPMENIKPTSKQVLAARLVRGAAGGLRSIGSLDVGTAATVNQLSKILVLKENQRGSLEAIQKETGANIGVIWAPPSQLNTTSIDADEMKMAKSQAFRNTIDLFGGEQPDEIPSYTSQKELLRQAIENAQRKAA
jgi:predicted patatin/cPLA2 family phospholipase